MMQNLVLNVSIPLVTSEMSLISIGIRLCQAAKVTPDLFTKQPADDKQQGKFSKEGEKAKKKLIGVILEPGREKNN